MEEGCSIASWIEYFDKKLRQPSCLPECIEELCGGCKYIYIYIGTQDTFQQVYLKLVKNAKIPLKLYFSSPEEMEILSNKRTALKGVFDLMDTERFGNSMKYTIN